LCFLEGPPPPSSFFSPPPPPPPPTPPPPPPPPLPPPHHETCPADTDRVETYDVIGPRGRQVITRCVDCGAAHVTDPVREEGL
jgi:hypothetical protein